MKKLLLTLSLAFLCVFGHAETKLPAPTQRFTDHANVVSPEVANRIEAQLAELEKTDSTQFVVYIYPTLDTESSMEDYTQRTAQEWGIGQKGKNNGLVLFLFAKDTEGFKRIRFETGYGLEGVFPDAKSKLIMEREIIPALKKSDWNTALTQGVSASIAQIKGEYTATEVKTKSGSFWFWVIVVGCVWVVCLIFAPRATIDITCIVIDIFLAKKSGGSGGSSWSGGGGSFGGGGSSGRA